MNLLSVENITKTFGARAIFNDLTFWNWNAILLNNIIKNSIQACANRPDSQIHLRLYNQDQTIIISVQDNGRGIPEDQKEKIFQPHFTTKSKGSGIGLSIVKQIVENHGGQIFFESSPNLGTTFTIVLPTTS